MGERGTVFEVVNFHRNLLNWELNAAFVGRHLSIEPFCLIRRLARGGNYDDGLPQRA